MPSSSPAQADFCGSPLKPVYLVWDAGCFVRKVGKPWLVLVKSLKKKKRDVRVLPFRGRKARR